MAENYGNFSKSILADSGNNFHQRSNKESVEGGGEKHFQKKLDFLYRLKSKKLVLIKTRYVTLIKNVAGLNRFYNNTPTQTPAVDILRKWISMLALLASLIKYSLCQY